MIRQAVSRLIYAATLTPTGFSPGMPPALEARETVTLEEVQAAVDEAFDGAKAFFGGRRDQRWKHKLQQIHQLDQVQAQLKDCERGR